MDKQITLEQYKKNEKTIKNIENQYGYYEKFFGPFHFDVNELPKKAKDKYIKAVTENSKFEVPENKEWMRNDVLYNLWQNRENSREVTYAELFNIVGTFYSCPF